MRAALLLTLAVATAGCDRPAQPPADLVLKNGYVYTVDAARSVAEAIAIRGDRIVAVGRAADVEPFIGADTQVRDLGGRMVMPGIHDAHIHAIGTTQPDLCDFAGEERSLDEMVPFLQDCIERHTRALGDWLVVVQWPFARGNQPSERHPTLRAALDAASTVHPILLVGDDGHHGAANSAALAQARDTDGRVVGIDRETLATTFAEWHEHVAVDGNGDPTGGINEGARLLLRPELFQDMIGVGSDPATVMPKVAAALASNGITSIQDAAVDAATLAMYRWLDTNGDMTFRVRTALFERPTDSASDAGLARIPAYMAHFGKLRDESRDLKHVRADAVKLFADGVLEGNPFTTPPTLPVAAVLNGYQQPIFRIDPERGSVEIAGYVVFDGQACTAVNARPTDYANADAIAAFTAANGHPPSQCVRSGGVLEHSEAFIRAFVRAATEAGFAVHVHAISDRGVRVAVSAFADVADLAREKGLTQSLAHVQLAHPDDQRRIGEIGAYVAFTYSWMVPNIAYNLMVIPFIERVSTTAGLFDPSTYYMQNVYPVRGILAAGGHATFGSDVPVDTRDPRPFWHLEQAITRAEEDRVLNAAQRLDVHEALAAFTIEGARMLSQADTVGSLEIGKVADLIVLDRNVVELADAGRAGDISDTRVLTTVFDGRIVYDATP